MTLRPPLTLLALLAATVISVLYGLSAGAIDIPLKTILNTLFDLEGDKQSYIINRSRLPRMILALITGASLALSGVIIQALLRNPLASPKIIGVNSGAALAVLLCAMIAPDLAMSWLPIIATTGGLLAAGIILFLAELRPVAPARLALVGIAVGMTADAGVDFIMVTADTYEISAPLVWLTGSLWARGWQHVMMVSPVLVFLCSLAFALFFKLDLLKLGAEQAQSLGQPVKHLRLALLIIAAGLAAVSVSAVGVIGFVGLMSPHIAHRLVGGHHAVLIPAAMLVGACLVTLADGVGRAFLPPIEISAGILTALFGAPFFVLLLLSSREGDAQ